MTSAALSKLGLGGSIAFLILIFPTAWFGVIDMPPADVFAATVVSLASVIGALLHWKFPGIEGQGKEGQK
ncbi:MAG: hypothetical protein WAT93_14760 [Pontixanthobacter sp.]